VLLPRENHLEKRIAVIGSKCCCNRRSACVNPSNVPMNSPGYWYYHTDGRGFGPVKETEIRVLLAQNEIAADTLVWRDGLSNWTEAHSTELGGAPAVTAVSPAPISIVGLAGKKRSKSWWLIFFSAEVFNGVVFGALPLLIASALSH
jgi:hypothetical protein